MAQRGNIDTFKSNVYSDFARPNLFQVDVNFPTDIGLTDASALKTLANFVVRAANLPASQIGVVEVPFRGRVLKLAGDRTFEPWTITIQNDSGFKLRTAFETWMQKIQEYDENYTSIAVGDAGTATTGSTVGYFADMEVHQLSRNEKGTTSGGTGTTTSGSHKVIKSYKFFQVFPSNIAAIDLDFGNNDAVEEFTVELQVQYWKPITGTANSAATES